MVNSEQMAATRTVQREEEKVKLIKLAEQIAHGWADKLGLTKEAVEWVTVGGVGRTPISTGILVHWLDGDAGIAFQLAAPDVINLLFVVMGKGATYSVNISNSARPWEKGERLSVRADRLGDLKRLLEMASKYVHRAAP